jgi:hypothetical protein
MPSTQNPDNFNLQAQTASYLSLEPEGTYFQLRPSPAVCTSAIAKAIQKMERQMSLV